MNQTNRPSAATASGSSQAQVKLHEAQDEQGDLVVDKLFTQPTYSRKGSEYDLIHMNSDNISDNLDAPYGTHKVRLIGSHSYRLMFEAASP